MASEIILTEDEKRKSMENLRAEIFGYVKEQIRVRRWLTAIFFSLLVAIVVGIVLILTRPLPSAQMTLREITLLREDAAKAREENMLIQKMFFRQDSLRYKLDSLRTIERDSLFVLP